MEPPVSNATAPAWILNFRTYAYGASQVYLKFHKRSIIVSVRRQLCVPPPAYAGGAFCVSASFEAIRHGLSSLGLEVISPPGHQNRDAVFKRSLSMYPFNARVEKLVIEATARPCLGVALQNYSRGSRATICHLGSSTEAIGGWHCVHVEAGGVTS